MSYRPGCGCGNWWNTPLSVCGPFDEPQNPDQGQCSPYRVKLSCERPVIPPPQCPDDIPQIILNPDTGRFTILSTLFDENCSAITDQNGSPIITAIAN